MKKAPENHPLTTHAVFPTAIGWCGVVDTRRGVLKIYIGYAARLQLVERIAEKFGGGSARGPATGELITAIKGYCCGENVSFPRGILDWSSLSPFQQRVYSAAAKIPYGSVTTYGLLSRELGCLRAARAVGSALARNPFPLVVPCHRIVRSDGTVGGFSAGEGTALKLKLLDLEQAHPGGFKSGKTSGLRQHSTGIPSERFTTGQW